MVMMNNRVVAATQNNTSSTMTKGGTLLPPPPPSLDGGIQLSIHIEKIGLKNAAQYLDPFVTVQVIGILRHHYNVVTTTSSLFFTRQQRKHIGDGTRYPNVQSEEGELRVFCLQCGSANKRKQTSSWYNCSNFTFLAINFDWIYSILGSAILFEFKHWKPKGEYFSTKCWSFMELDEIKPGPAVLEMYVCFPTLHPLIHSK